MQALVVADPVHLPDDPGLVVEAVLEQVGVVFREVAVVIGQRIHVQDPYLVGELHPLLSAQELHLDDLLGLGFDEQLEEVACQPFGLLALPAGEHLRSAVVGHLQLYLRGVLGLLGPEQLVGQFLVQPTIVPVILQLLEVLYRRQQRILHPVDALPLILADLLLVDLLVDDVLLVGRVVQLGAGELEVVELLLAVLAGQHLELVGDVADLVPDEAEELVVHVAFLEDLDEARVVQLEQHRERQGLYLVQRPLLGEEVQASEEGHVSLSDLDEVDDLIVQDPLLLADVPYLTLLQDHEVEVIVDTPDDLLGMRDLYLKVLCEVVQRTVQQIPEEDQLLEHCFVGLPEVAGLEGVWQLVQELLVVLMVELLLEVGGLLDVVVDLELQVDRHEALVGQLLEDLELLAALDVLRADVGDDFPHAVDVVGHDDAAEGFDEDQADGFGTIGGHDVPEAHCQHDVGGPVVRPDVLLGPARVGNALDGHPVL